MKNKPYSIILWILFLLFCFRVSSQLLQYFSPVSFLPDFDEWHSATLPYAVLVFFQFLIIAFCLYTCIRMSRGKLLKNKKHGKRYLILGSLYALSMVIRYIIRMSLYPDERWFGGCIPILFHIILASFLITLGIYHSRHTTMVVHSEKNGNTIKNSLYIITLLLISGCQLIPSMLASKMKMRKAEYTVSVTKKVAIPMNDGKPTYANIYKPKKLSSAPTILVRIPLDNNFKGRFMSNIVGRIWAQRGYNVVIQGVRGRFHSKEKHIPFIYEREDGIATLRWLNQQSWHNGKTGMWGGSYFGYTQWVLSDQDSLGLKAMFTQISSSSNYRMFYPGGTFAYETALFWATRSHSDKDTPMKYKILRNGYDQGTMLEADSRVVEDIFFLMTGLPIPHLMITGKK
ncbi:MAG: CocE/NonD family hydrolase [Cytophagaceae bacterium]|nr:CocE/NonD family hydrolase [Cytophagaceae bacterium]